MTRPDVDRKDSIEAAYRRREVERAEERRRTAAVGAPIVRGAATAAFEICTLCADGFRRRGGVHVGSQRLGMISNTPCDDVFATLSEGAHQAKPWIAYADGAPLRTKRGEAKRFASPKAAYRAAQGASLEKWT